MGPGSIGLRQDLRSRRAPDCRQRICNPAGLDKQLVFYWYQGRGRVIASEYSGKFWMVADAISRNRTDGALVRVITPMNDGEAWATCSVSEVSPSFCFQSLESNSKLILRDLLEERSP